MFFHTEHYLPRCTAGTVAHRHKFYISRTTILNAAYLICLLTLLKLHIGLKTNRTGMQSLSPVITLEIPQEGSSWCPLNAKGNFWNASKASCSHEHLWTTSKTEKAEYFLSLRDTLGALTHSEECIRRANTKVHRGWSSVLMLFRSDGTENSESRQSLNDS